MKNLLLFPRAFKSLGLALSFIFLLFGYFILFKEFQIPQLGWKNLNFTDELCMILAISGLVFVTFSKLKTEDEFTMSIRLESIKLGLILNYLIFTLVIIANNTLLFLIEKENLFGYWNVLSDLNILLYFLFVPLILISTIFYYKISQFQAFKIQKTKEIYLKKMPFQYIGKFISITSIILMFCDLIFNTEFREVAWYTLILGLLIWAVTKDPKEDEYSKKLKLNSWMISLYTHYALIIISTLFIHGLDYLWVLWASGPSLLLFYILIYNTQTIRSN